ncbi:MAG: hypothetical protein GY705_12880 [Bacteroidetes bacterium]|nr:hypothetical protein [Bacteroidota bacterium]
MVETNEYYYFFDFVIKSNTPLPELQESPYSPPLFSFSLCTTPIQKKPKWIHHWYLPNGEISISFAREADRFYLRFPNLADFIFDKKASHITGNASPEIPIETVRHLLLDQVLPRIVSHLGRPAIHACGVHINNFALLFLGETGWGKSTLGAYFDQQGNRLLSDDCLLLEEKNGQVVALPSYASMRLMPDSYDQLIPDQKKNMGSSNVAHYSSKKRIVIKSPENLEPAEGIPLEHIFILNDPFECEPGEKITIKPLQGALAAIELVKNSFHLDITDSQFAREQMLLLTRLCNNENLHLYSITYQRDHNLLPRLHNHLLSFLSDSLEVNDL